MRIISYEGNPTELAGLIDSHYPFCFLKEYSDFVSSTQNQQVLFFISEEGAISPVSRWGNGFLHFLKFIFPPVLRNKTHLTAEQEAKFLKQALYLVYKNKLADRIVHSSPYCIFQVVPEKASYCRFGTYFVNLADASVEQLFNALHSKHRNVIRNAERAKARIVYGLSQVPVFYELYAATMKRSGMYCESLSYFNEMFRLMGEGKIVCGVVYHEDVPQGAVFMPYTQFGIYYLFGASAEKITLTGAMNYLHWNLILEMKRKGVMRYDFVGARLSDVSGTRLDGIQRFKERFGSVVEQGFLWKLDIDIFKCKVFDSLLAIRLRLKGQTPPVDIIDQERMKLI